VVVNGCALEERTKGFGGHRCSLPIENAREQPLDATLFAFYIPLAISRSYISENRISSRASEERLVKELA